MKLEEMLIECDARVVTLILDVCWALEAFNSI